MDEAAPAPSAPLRYLAPAAALIAAAGFAISGAGSHTVWYVVRATGIVSYALVTLTVACGLLVTNRAAPPGDRRFDLFEAHRFLALLAICGGGLHALTLLLDSYIGFSPSQVLVPFTSDYRPLSVGLGVIALYVSIAVYGSFYVKRWVGQKAWRALHYSTFAVFTLATYHGILSGADTGAAWMLALYLAAILSVLGLLAVRVARASAAQEARPARPSRTQRPAPATKGSIDFDWRRPDIERLERPPVR